MEGPERIMSDEHKSKAELLQELNALRKRICELEQANQTCNEFAESDHSDFEEQFRELSENIPVGVYRTAPDGRIIMANSSLVQMLGFSSFQELSHRNLEKGGFASGYPRSEFKDLIEKEGKVVGLESAWKRRDGTTLFIIENARAVRDESGKTLYYEGMVQDITERKRAQEEMRESEEKHRKLFEETTDAIFVADAETGILTDCNRAASELVGIEKSELIGKHQQILHPSQEIEGGFSRTFKQHLAEKEGQVLESQVITKKGEIKDVTIRASRFVLKGKEQIQGLFRDVTDRKRAEKQRNELLSRLNAIIGNVPAWIFLKDVEGRYIAANRAFFDILPMSVDDPIGKRDRDLFRKDLADIFEAENNEVLHKGLKIIRERCIRLRNGRVGYMLISLAPVLDHLSNIVGLVAIAVDITERKKAEQALQVKKAILQNIISNIPYYVFWKDNNSIYLGCNDNFAKLAGVEKVEDIVGKTDYDLPWKKEESDFYRKIDKEVMSKGEPILNVEEPIHHGKGEVATVLTSKVPLRNTDGEITGILGIFTDITELKKMEEALRESQRWQRAILDTIPDMAWLKDKESKYIAVNEALCKAFGIKFEDFVGKTDLDISPKDLAEKYRADDQEVIKSGKRKLIEEPWGRKQGERIWIETIKTPIYNDQGQIIGTSGIARDITDRKNLERALIESERRYRTLFNTTPVGVGLATIDGKILTCNNAMLDITGYSEAEIRQINLKDTYVNPHKRVELLEKLRTNNLVQNFEVQLKRKDGTTYWASLTVSKFDQAGQDVILTVSLDITEHKKAEEKIKTLITAIEQSIDGIAITDMEPKLLYVNEAFARMHDYTPDEIIGMPVAKLHNKEQEKQITGGIHQVKTHGSMEGEIEHIKKDGTSFPTYMSVTLLKDNDGRPSGMLAVARDITESKQREEELNNYGRKMARSERLASLGTLSAGLAHELNQPLTVITLSIENLLADMETMQHPGAVVDRLREMLDEVSKVTSIARRFRDAARASSQRVYSQVDLKYVAEKTLKLFEERAQRAKITLVLRGFNKLPFVYTSEEEMGQLFFALVENAIQAADGKKNHRLVISGAVKEQHIELQFSDNCSGIKPEYLGRIFEPFFSTKLAGEATGLGLCIAENVVSRAGGKIHVESKRRKGTTFYITLPVKAETNYLTKRGK